MRRLVSLTALVVGWMLVVVAAVYALLWMMVMPTLHGIRDFGLEAAKATFAALWILPLLIAVSASILYLSRRTEGFWQRRLYRIFLAIALLVWLLAICEFQFRFTHGWELFLGK